MSGIISFDESRVWCGATYAFRHILSKVVEYWPPDGSLAVRDELASAIDDGNNYVNLSRVSKEDLDAFHAGVARLHRIARATGPTFLYDPEAYEPYMRWLEELELMSRGV